MLFFHPLDFNDAISSSEVADLEGDTSRRGLDVGTPMGTPTDHRGTKNQWVFFVGKISWKSSYSSGKIRKEYLNNDEVNLMSGSNIVLSCFNHGKMLPLFLTCFQLEMFENWRYLLQWSGFVFLHVQQWLIIGDTIGSIGGKKTGYSWMGFTNKNQQ